ncbi:uncharacterized protein LOC109794300 [Cajanus cajan]|uniref:uncharacterized protein LOC109794298 n=1 Tax=Cajanus cajan TaxID=3821 RepID=UPI00098DA66B|nr:uncharacterized protein LOC109794298 [Cajanus cajan]XP_020209344.1 uncharacterized protein LOC109794300 [Cajanus cajan]
MDPIKYLLEKSVLIRRVARWQVLLLEYDIVYVSQNAIKGSVLADYLASGPTSEECSMKDDFPDEEILALGNDEEKQNKKESWSMFFDEASNLMGYGIGAILMPFQGKHILVTVRLDFECTNNMAGYEDCLLGLQVALDNNITKIEVYGDSALVIHQLRDEKRDHK